MSLTYNGTTSVLASDATQTIGSLWSAAAWAKFTTDGGSNFGYLVSHGPGLGERISWLFNGAGTHKFSIFCRGAGQWDMTTGFASVPTPWMWLGFTLDATTNGNRPTMYTLIGNTFSTLTVGSGLTEVTALTAAALAADNVTHYVGTGGTGGVTDGSIGEFAFWKRILTASEMEAIAFDGVNVCPDHFNYLPQDGGSVQNLGSSGTAFTATNTAVGENPPIRPAGRRG